MISGHDIIILSGVFYDDLWTSKQQVARRLARRNRVLFVEPYLTLVTPLSVPEERAHWVRGLRSPFRTADGLTIYAPPPLLPFRSASDIIQRLNDGLYTAAVRSAARKLGFRRPILWSFLYDVGSTVGKLNEIVSIYHCADDWSEMPIPRKNIERIKKLEGDLSRRVNLVFSAAQRNAERLCAYNPRSYYIPNGVDFELFNLAAGDGLRVPDDLLPIPAPRLAFVGTLHTWVDFELIEYVARSRPAWSLVLIGPAKIDVSRLAALPNVHLLGKKPREHLPAYLQAVDACLIPFRDNKLTQAVNPLKLYEYLATGVPVVSTDLAEVRTAEPHVLVAATPEEFVAQAERAMMSRDSGAAPRVAFARANSWDGRVEMMSGLIEEWLAAHSTTIARR